MSINDNNNELDKEGICNELSNETKKINDSKYTLAIIIGVVLFIITNVVSYIFGLKSYHYSSFGIKSLGSDIIDYRKILSVRDILYKNYGMEIDSKVLLDGAISGMVDSLGDPYTTYMDEKEIKDFNSTIGGEHIGIGVEIRNIDNDVVIVSVVDDSPAHKAGIHVGDIISTVSGEKVNNADDAFDLLVGEEGTEVSLEIKRDDSIHKFTIKRDKFNLSSVYYEKIDDRIGYISMLGFDENSSKEIRKALEDLKSDGIILDLRSNPGGYLDECVNIVSEFLDEGLVIVSTDNKFGKKEEFKAKQGVAKNTKLVIIGNSGSASASEVLIAALRDHNRSTFVGEKTYGKGLVQQIFELGDGSGVKVTTSKYYTPNGEYINGIGINPDVEIKYTMDERLKHIEEAKGDIKVLRKLDPQYQKALEIIREQVYN